MKARAKKQNSARQPLLVLTGLVLTGFGTPIVKIMQLKPFAMSPLSGASRRAFCISSGEVRSISVMRGLA